MSYNFFYKNSLFKIINITNLPVLFFVSIFQTIFSNMNLNYSKFSFFKKLNIEIKYFIIEL